ncbi:MAG: thioredoxin [Bacteroidales bacterium]|jgi:thioredoxin 1|nr:thioredoxin [Bacteroidales bacterium]
MKKTILFLTVFTVLSFFTVDYANAQDSKIKILTETNFDSGISKGLVFVDFYADWCRPCRMMQPVLEEFAKEYSSKIVVAKLNTDQNKNLSQKYQITGIPCMILFKDGKEIKRVVGFRDKAGLLTELSDYLK